MLDQLVNDLKREEGFRAFVYDDETGEPIVPGYKVVGHPTIWYGLCVEKGRVPDVPDRIPEELLEFVAMRKWDELIDREPWIVDQPEGVQRALASMAYQMGVNGVLTFVDMIAALRAGDLDAAADEALDSKWAVQTPARAQRVADLIRFSR